MVDFFSPVLSHPDILFLKHASRILRRHPNLNVVSPWWNRLGSVLLGSSMNHIQGWMIVWECCRHALEQGTLLSACMPVIVIDVIPVRAAARHWHFPTLDGKIPPFLLSQSELWPRGRPNGSPNRVCYTHAVCQLGSGRLALTALWFSTVLTKILIILVSHRGPLN